MKIAGLQKVSLIDYPERVAASVFLAGCNLNCGYCHNRWMIREADVPEALSMEDFFRWLKGRVGLLEGVCVGGGEPTLHSALPSFARSIKALGFAVKLDTNGTLPGRLAPLLDEGLVDYVAMDLKAPLDVRYVQVAGCAVDLRSIRECMGLLRTKALAYEFRTTVSPLVGEDALRDIGQEIIDGERWYLQPFVAAPGVDPRLAEAEALGEENLCAIVERLSSVVPGVCLRGV